MNTVITSKEAILQVCRRMVAENGIKALNMRSVAHECHIASGTLYNYYADKDALILATVESIWREIFHTAAYAAVQPQAQPQVGSGLSFADYVAQLYARIMKGTEAYPGFLTGHSVSIAGAKRGEAKSIMEHTFAHMKAGMLNILQSDPSVPKNAFPPTFSKEDFVGFVLDHLLILSVQGQPNCDMLLQIIRRVIYGSQQGC
ncbi:MAG: TetR/AcrR family transcriptional regulator [Acutalibacteraceae bacterium]